MTKIGDAARLAALMQLQMSPRQASGTGAKAADDSRADALSRRREMGRSRGESASPVSREVLLSVRELRGVGDALSMAAFRVFLRHRLIKELGAITSDDASFEVLLNEVLAAMESDSGLKESMLEAGQQFVVLSRQLPD